jgi:hypothetical protein
MPINSPNIPNPKMAAARSFVRSLNILLKFVRLYGFEHVRSAEQFHTAWSELRAAIPMGDQTGLLLGAAGSQLVLDGAPIEGAHAERSFAQLLSAAGLASIQFLPKATENDFARFVRAFPAGNSKPSALAEQLKQALSDSTGIRINEVRYVAEDSSMPEKSLAATLAAKTLGGEAGQFSHWLNDPQKLLQLITAAEGSRGGSVGTSSGGGDSESGNGDGDGEGTGSFYSGSAFDESGDGPAGDENSGSGGGGIAGATGSGDGVGGWHEAGTGSGPGPGTGTASTFSGGMGIGGSGTGGKGTGGWSAGAGSGSGVGIGGAPGSGAGSGTGPETGGGGAGVGFGSGGSGSGVGSGSDTASGSSGGSGSSGAGSGPGGSNAGAVSSAGLGAGPGAGPGLGPGLGPGKGGAPSQGRPGGTGGRGGSGGPGSGGAGGLSGVRDPRDEEIVTVLRLLSRIGKSATGGPGGGLGLGAGGSVQQEIEKIPDKPRNLLRAALMNLGAQVPDVKSNDPMLLRLAEHLAIRFALDRYERGEVRVNAVRQMLDRMSQEISGLREVLGSHEEKMASAGLLVESHLDVLDRQFWSAVPDSGKRAVLTSPDAWCIPPRNLRSYVEELRRNGEDAIANTILENYSSAIKNADATARRRVAIGLPELADLYAFNERLLGSTIRLAGVQLAIEREDDLQGLISATFVRLAQEAGTKRFHGALLQALDSLDGIENQRPAFAQSVRPRLGIEKRIIEFVDEALRSPSPPDTLLDLLKRMPSAVTEHLVSRFNRTQFKADCERIADLAGGNKLNLTSRLRETVHIGQPMEAAEAVGLLSQLDITAVEKRLGERLHEWPRLSQDRALRLLAAGGAPSRGSVMLAVLDRFDPILQPLAVDEIGMSGEATAYERLMRLVSDELPRGTGPYLRLKAIEALGRLRSTAATELLREIAEAKKRWRKVHHPELRIAALQALEAISPASAESLRAQSGFSDEHLSLTPRASSSKSRWLRQRRYPRVRLKATVPATATSERETVLLDMRGLSLSGGLATGAKHLPPGTLVSLRLGSGLRPIRAQAIMRDARAQGLSFEFASMDLDDRARLRSFLRQNGAALTDLQDAEETDEETVAQDR